MKPNALIATLAAAFLGACASPFPAASDADSSLYGRSQARDLVAASVATHGTDPYSAGRTITTHLDGEWSSLAEKLQPVLVDSDFRRSSVDTYALSTHTTSQTHRGPQGTKTVVRNHRERTTQVAYNGQPATDPEVIAAAALVADAYLMFNTSPSYFLHTPNSGFSLLPDAELEGRPHHRIRTTINPGLGDAESDDVVLWIDAETKRATRVHFTLNGLESTQGAHVDVTALDYRTHAGTLYPTRFTEVVRAPIRFTAHDWTTTRLEAR